MSWFLFALITLWGFGAVALQAQSTFTITSATDGTSLTIPEGANGAVLNLAGTLPGAQQINDSTILACFYTGNGSVAALPLTAPTSTTPEQLSVPASLIQAIPQSSFTAANGYSVTAFVYFAQPDAGLCDGFPNTQLTNEYPVAIVAPALGTYTGPTSIPQTNPSTNVQAAPLFLTLPASGFLTGAASGGTSSINFGNLTSAALSSFSASSVTVQVPAALSSSAVGTTASLTICNTPTGVTTPICTTPSPSITLTVTALANSLGTITATPTPVLTSGQTVLTAQFTKAANAGTATNLGAPSGTVSFTAAGATVAPAVLVLDTSATFASQTTSLTLPAAPTPVITPAAGSYTGAQTVTIAEPLTNAAIYYTQDGTTPTTSSTLYAGPFSITASETVKAIAVVSGFLNSAVASATYAITILPPTQLAFAVQPPSTALLNTAISPAVQVALEDVNGTVVVNSSAAVTLALSRNPGQTTLGGTTTVNAVNGIATFPNLTIGVLGTGYSLQASSSTLPSVTSSLFNVTPPSITLTVPLTVPIGSTVPIGLVGINATLGGSFTLGAPAPAGGLVVTLTSGTPANVTVAPATVNVAAGQTTGAFTFSGVAAGTSTLSASATGYQTGTVQTQATSAQVSLGMIPNVAPAQMQSLAVSLPNAAPPGGTTITFTIGDPTIASVTSSITVPQGLTTATANPQVTGILIGTTTVTANAPGYAPAVRPVVVTVTAAFNPGTTNINLTTASTTSLTISAPAPPGGIVFTLSSDSPTIASVPASVTVVAGATSVPIAITGVSAGSTTIRADSTGITEATGTVNVDSQIGTSTFTTGYDVEENTGVYLPVSPLSPTTVTLTSSDPTVAVISTAYNTAGQQTLTFPNTTSSYVGGIYVQGLKIGTSTISVSAPGYNAGSIVVTVDPTGFVYYYYATGFSTTTYASPTSLTIYPAILDSTSNNSVYRYSRINPQSGTVSVPVTSSVTATGTVASPVVFKPLDTYESFNFTPGSTTGTTNVDIGTPPAGFAVPPENQQQVATVTTPTITVNNVLTAAKLQKSAYVNLQNGPPSAVNVTLTVADPTVAVISTSDTVAGSASLTINVAAGQTSIGPIWIQGLKAGFTTTLTATAATGYTVGSGTITVDASGFMYYYYQGNLSPTSFSGPSNVYVYTAVLNPMTLAVVDFEYELSPGVGPVNVGITDSATGVGTISPTTLVFNTTDTAHYYAFQPVAAGTTNLTINTPTGFSTPTQYQQISATVTAPAISVSNVYSGVNLENNYGVYLPIAPPSSRTVTITSSDPTTALISLSQTAVGSASVTFTADANTTSTTIWIQGKKAGTATLTVSATGYTTGTSTITIYPSGFAYYYNPPPTTTTTFSSPNTVNVSTVILNPTSSNVIGPNLLISPGVAPATVIVTDSAPSVGTISSSSLLFSPGDYQHSFTFQPLSAGTTTVSLTVPTGTMSAPTGFTTASNNESVTVTVTAPAININNVTVAKNLQQSLSISLPQTPPNNNGNGVTVIVTSSSPQLATLSTDPTVPGTASVTFSNVTSASVGTIYVQGQALGTANLTETAPGYTDGSSTITVLPAGFAFYYGGPNINTTVANGPSGNVTVYPVALTTGTLTLTSSPLMVNPGLGNVDVTVTSSDTTVGTIETSPLVFAPGAGTATFRFVPVGTGTTTISIQTPTTPSGFSTPSQNTTGTATVQ